MRIAIIGGLRWVETASCVVHPYRLIHAQGGLYLIAFVPAYAEVRTSPSNGFGARRCRSRPSSR
jgi:hypothetical protein